MNRWAVPILAAAGLVSCRDAATPQRHEAPTTNAADAAVETTSAVGASAPDAAPDGFVAPLDAGPSAVSVPLELKKPRSVCGMTVTLTTRGHEEHETQGIFGIWELTLTKGPTVMAVSVAARELYAEGLAHGCLYVLEGKQGSERVTAAPSAEKALSETEALALAKEEATARGFTFGPGRSYSTESGVLDVIFGAGSSATRVRVGLATRRVIAVARVPAP